MGNKNNNNRYPAPPIFDLWQLIEIAEKGEFSDAMLAMNVLEALPRLGLFGNQDYLDCLRRIRLERAVTHFNMVKHGVMVVTTHTGETAGLTYIGMTGEDSWQEEVQQLAMTDVLYTLDVFISVDNISITERNSIKLELLSAIEEFFRNKAVPKQSNWYKLDEIDLKRFVFEFKQSIEMSNLPLTFIWHPWLDMEQKQMKELMGEIFGNKRQSVNNNPRGNYTQAQTYNVVNKSGRNNPYQQGYAPINPAQASVVSGSNDGPSRYNNNDTNNKGAKTGDKQNNRNPKSDKNNFVRNNEKAPETDNVFKRLFGR